MSTGGHWYTTTGQTMHWKPCKSKPGNRATTLADAKKENLLPGVTSILKLLAKPQLEQWKTKQAVMAVLTSSREPEETLDQFADRVLNQEHQQDQESKIAMDRGTEIHDALEKVCAKYIERDEFWENHPLADWINKPFNLAISRFKPTAVEQVYVGKGYAGRADLVGVDGESVWIVDWKTAKKLPDADKGSWPEHRLQLAALAAAYTRAFHSHETRIRLANIYISTTEPNSAVMIENTGWEDDARIFGCIVEYWQWFNDYIPQQ